MLKILHTADWHLGHTSRQFEPTDCRKLARDRLTVIDEILGLAEQHDVGAVLCAGDLFDSKHPEEVWWRGLAEKFRSLRLLQWKRPIFLLPGNHDPLMRDSPYEEGSRFRELLPDWVHVVDRDDYAFELGPDALLLAAPCRTTAGSDDLALGLPARPLGDTRIRIGLVHGSTFEMPGYQTNFPIARDAGEQRGLDYLAIGDTHAFCQAAGSKVPTVYPSTPEATNFGESETGYVAIVSFTQPARRVTIQKERVGKWLWRDDKATSLAELRLLAALDLRRTVLRLELDLSVSVAELAEVEAILALLQGTAAAHGRAGVCVVRRTRLQVDVSAAVIGQDAPDAIQVAAQQLHGFAAAGDTTAKQALVLLHRLYAENL